MATVVPQSRGPRRNIGGGVGAGVAAFFGERDKQNFQRTLAEAEQSGDKDTYRKLLMDKAESLEDALTVDKIVNRKFPDATEEIIGYDETGAERKLRIPPNLDQAKRDQLLRSKGLQATKPLGKAEPFEDAQGRATGSFLPGRQPKGSRRTSSAEAARDRRSREGIAARSATNKGSRKDRLLDQMAANWRAGKPYDTDIAPTDAASTLSEFGDPITSATGKSVFMSPDFFRRNALDAVSGAKFIMDMVAVQKEAMFGPSAAQAKDRAGTSATGATEAEVGQTEIPTNLPDPASWTGPLPLRDKSSKIRYDIVNGEWKALGR